MINLVAQGWNLQETSAYENEEEPTFLILMQFQGWDILELKYVYHLHWCLGMPSSLAPSTPVNMD